MKEVADRLFEMQDIKYAAFQKKLIPNIDPDSIIGVRVPILRQFSKEFAKEPIAAAFLSELPHQYYDETMLHGLVLSQMKDYQQCLDEIEKFLPYVDNWAVCDLLAPKIFRKNKADLIVQIRRWAASSEPYTCRFGLEMLMSHFLDADFQEEYLKIPAAVISEEYYVNMMIAWFFATALAKQWEAAIPYVEQQCLPIWVHNKTIQKAVESYRITDEQKNYLRSLRRK